MNVFEDLIEELKEANLLESTIIPTGSSIKDEAYDEVVEAETFLEKLSAEETGTDAADVSAGGENSDEDELRSLTLSELIPSASPSNEADFYRRRAIDEVARLQMVEHILSGIERDYMKIVPKTFDDLEVKKVLHAFIQVSSDVNSPEHAPAEFQLMQETESWYSALAHRDKHISVANLRRYCETARPVLSSQALIALAGFYRNLPYYESARNKFDFVFTKLFSKEQKDGKRSFVFERDELIKHIKNLYAEWSSLSYHSEDEDDSELLLSVFKFEDFMAEAESAESFDELIRKDFFNRLRLFKESANEKFFAPLVTAAAIESNIRIGNRYVDLLKAERENGEAENIENKYGFLHDQVISDATSKTLKLVDLIKDKKSDYENDSEKKAEELTEQKVAQVNPKAAKASPNKQEKRDLLGFNKWLMALTILVVLGSFALHFWAESYSSTPTAATTFKSVDLESSEIKEHVKNARVGKEILFAVVQPSWEDLSRAKQEEILKNIRAAGSAKGFNSVHLEDEAGKTVGAATADQVIVY